MAATAEGNFRNRRRGASAAVRIRASIRALGMVAHRIECALESRRVCALRGDRLDTVAKQWQRGLHYRGSVPRSLKASDCRRASW